MRSGTRSGTTLNLFGLIKSRASSDRRMIAGLVVGALFAAAIAAGIPQYGRTLEMISMRASVEDVQPFDTNLHVISQRSPLSASDSERQDGVVFSAVETYFGEMVVDSIKTIKSRDHWWGFHGEGLRISGEASQSSFLFMERLNDHVDYVTGVAPTDAVTELDGETVIEVSVFNDRAVMLQVGVGDVIDSRAVNRGLGMVRARITGTFERSEPDDIYWMGFGRTFLAPAIEGREQPLVMMTSSKSMFTEVAEADEGLPVTYGWFLYTDSAVIAGMKLDALDSSLEEFGTELERSSSNFFVVTRLNSRVKKMKERALFGSIPLLLMALLVFACVGFYLAMAAGLISRRRVSGYMALRSRGLNVRQQFGVHVFEAAIVAVPAAIIAPLVSYFVIGFLGYFPVYDGVSNGESLPVELSVLAWVWSFGGAVGTMLVITVASSFWDRSTDADSRSSDARPVGAPWFQRFYVDALVIGLSGILWWELAARNNAVISEGDVSPDLSLLGTPILIVFASALATLRIFPVATRLMASVGVRLNLTAVGQGFANVARRPFFHGWPILAIALSISTAIVAGSVVSTLERSTTEQIYYNTGADIHITATGSQGQLDPARIATVAGLESIGVVSPVLRTSSSFGTTSTGPSFTLLAVDPAGFPEIAWFRDDFSHSETSVPELIEGLAVQILANPVEIPSDTVELSLWVKSEPVTLNHRLWVVVKDGEGESHVINFDQFKEGWNLRTARFPELPQPVGVTSIQTFLEAGPDSAPPADIFVDDLIATSADGSKQVVLDFEKPGLWTGLPTSEGEDTGFAIVGEPSNLAGIVAGDAGEGIAKISLGRGWTQGIRGVYRRADDSPIPIIASEGFMKVTNVEQRVPFMIGVQGGLIPVEVTDVVGYFPTLDPFHEPFAVIDFDAVIEFVELRGGRTVAPNELFASLGVSGVEAANLEDEVQEIFRRAVVNSRVQLLSESSLDPVAVAGCRGMSVVATAIAALFVLMTYGIYLAAYSLRTKGDSALILALGASRRYFFISTVTELIPSVVIGIFTGLVTGVVVSSLMLGSLAHSGAYSGPYSGSGERLVPPFILQTDWSLPLITFIAVFVILLAGVLSSVRAFRKIQIARVARNGFSASRA